MKKLTRRDRRTLAIAGVFAAVVLVVFYVILPFLDAQSETESELANKERALSQRVRAIRGVEYYRSQIEQLDSVLVGLRAQLLDAENPTIAQNQLENIVREIAEENGVTISRSTPLQSRKVGEHYSKVTLQINVQSGMLELTSFLQALSAHSKYLQVEEFFINSFRVRDRYRLQPRMQISGFIQPSET
jgi:Tfp pilus assembly protein PilO